LLKVNYINFTVVDANKFPGSDLVWDSLVSQSDTGWCWHTRAWSKFVAAAKLGSVDMSFFVLENGIPICIAPMMLCEVRYAEHQIREASFAGDPMPWPCAVAGRNDAEEFAIVEAVRRARMSGAGKISFSFSSPLRSLDRSKWFDIILNQHGFLDTSYESHVVQLNADVFSQVRKRYRRDVSKYSKSFDIKILSGSQVDDKIEQVYFELHVADAGGMHRPRESYSFQADLARFGEGFFVVAYDKSNGNIVGMLLVSTYKKCAFDNSVAISPAFQPQCISHLLKWCAIDELLKRDFSTYELGIIYERPSYLLMPNDTQRGISFFKRGWSREGSRKLLSIEKYLNINSLELVTNFKLSLMRKFFQI
jgi:hypothetical protein